MKSNQIILYYIRLYHSVSYCMILYCMYICIDKILLYLTVSEDHNFLHGPTHLVVTEPSPDTKKDKQKALKQRTGEE